MKKELVYPDVTVYPHGRETFDKGPPEVVIEDHGCELVLVFPDRTGDGNILELRLRPAAEKLEPRVLRRFAPDAEHYVALARAALRWKHEDARGAVEALRSIGRPGRGLTDAFYRTIAWEYDTLLAEGEQHPVKAISEKHHVTISAASRWLKEARRRGLVDEQGDSDV